MLQPCFSQRVSQTFRVILSRYSLWQTTSLSFLMFSLDLLSVSTNPGEDAYVMVLQNKNGLFRDFRSVLASKDLCDITFLVGEERRPVIAVRAVIAARSRCVFETFSFIVPSTYWLNSYNIQKTNKTILNVYIFSNFGPKGNTSKSSCFVIVKWNG